MKHTVDTVKSASDLEIGNEVQLKFFFNDKRDAFSFPFLCSNILAAHFDEVYISEL